MDKEDIKTVIEIVTQLLVILVAQHDGFISESHYAEALLEGDALVNVLKKKL